MKQEIDNNAMWAAFRQELALQGELQVVAAIDNALNNLGFTIEETSTIVPIPLKQGEQNPAWSEEDENNFKHLLDEIVCLGNNRNSANRLYCDRLIKFIEELKNRAQPKEKWCDKDERMLDRLIAYFEKQVVFTDDDNPRYANWLKSLKDRYTWKPSDLQIKALEYYTKIGCVDKEGFFGSELVKLLEELKKL